MDNNKTLAPPKINKMKRPCPVNVPKTSRKVVANKDKPTSTGSRDIKNTTVMGGADVTVCKSDNSLPEFEAEYRQIAYGKFLRAMLEDAMVDEKIEREETDIDIQISQLADRFQKTMDQLDNTNKRLKDINFLVEQKRLLDMKTKDCMSFLEMTEDSNIEDMLKKLEITEKTYLDKLETRNVDFGYSEESGHKQLLDAVNDAIDGLVEIKTHSNLDLEKFKEYEKSHNTMEDLEKKRIELEGLKMEFDEKFPKFSEKLIMEASEKISAMIDNTLDE